MLTEGQKKARANRMGASNAASCMRKDGNWRGRFSSGIDFYDNKINGRTAKQEAEFDDNFHMNRGNVLEAFIRDECVKRYGYPIEVPQEGLVHPDYDWFICHVDGLSPSIENPSVIFEIKAPGPDVFMEWRAAGFHEEYVIQTQTQIATWNAHLKLQKKDPIELGVLVAYCGELIFEEVLPDEKKEKEIFDELEDFWQTHIVTGIAPPPDATKGYRRYHQRKFTLHGNDIVDDDDTSRGWFEKYITAREEEKAAEQRKELARAHLEDCVGKDRGFRGDGYRVLWGERKGKRSLDTKQIMRDLGINKRQFDDTYNPRGEPYRQIDAKRVKS